MNKREWVYGGEGHLGSLLVGATHYYWLLNRWISEKSPRTMLSDLAWPDWEPEDVSSMLIKSGYNFYPQIKRKRFNGKPHCRPGIIQNNPDVKSKVKLIFADTRISIIVQFLRKPTANQCSLIFSYSVLARLIVRYHLSSHAASLSFNSPLAPIPNHTDAIMTIKWPRQNAKSVFIVTAGRTQSN